MTQRSTTQRLADLILGQPVEDFITERRNAGRSWRHVERDLFEATNREIDVSYETLRGWHNELTGADVREGLTRQSQRDAAALPARIRERAS